MENTENPSPTMSFTDRMKFDLLQTAKWAKFLAIIGFIGLGFLVIMAFLMMAGSSIFQSLTNGVPLVSVLVGVLYLLICVVYLFPVLYLLRFADHTKLAVMTNDEVAMGEALVNQRKMYKYTGILMIVVLALYALAAIIWIPLAFMAVK